MRLGAIVIALILFTPEALFASQKNPARTNHATAPDEPVTVKAPNSHRVRQMARLPLDLPSYILRAATWPIGVGSRYLVESGALDRTLDFLSNKERTMWVYPIIEGGAGSGFGGGFGIKHSNLFHRGYRAGASYRIHINEDQIATGYFGQPDAFELAARPFSYRFDVDWQRYTGQDFYGSGNASSQANHSKYLLSGTGLNSRLAYHITKSLSTALILGVSYSRTGNSTRDGYPSISTTFPPNELAGFQNWISYLTAAFDIEYDTRDNKVLTETGGLVSASFRRFQNMGSGPYNFNRYNFDVRHSIRLWKPRSALTLHMGWVFNQSTGGSQIPFWQLAILDASTPLRGFSRGRFTDNDSAIFNAEYRFPLWEAFDGVVFYDTGRVFHNPPDFSFGNFKYSVGGGLRVRLFGIMLFRFDAAYGGEGMNYIFGVTKSL